MKKILSILLLCTASAVFAADRVVTFDLTSSNDGPAFLILTNKSNIKQIELTSTVGALVTLYDQSSVADPYFGTNVVLNSYTNVSSYATNLITTYIGANGITNTFTNTGIFTVMSATVKATNELSPAAAYVVSGNSYAVYTADLLLNRGLCVRASSNVTGVIYYNTAGR